MLIFSLGLFIIHLYLLKYKNVDLTLQIALMFTYFTGIMISIEPIEYGLIFFAIATVYVIIGVSTWAQRFNRENFEYIVQMNKRLTDVIEGRPVGDDIIEVPVNHNVVALWPFYIKHEFKMMKGKK